MINFYHRFIPKVAGTLHPLYDALKSPKNKPLVWTPAMTSAFLNSKSALASSTMLSHPVTDAAISLTVDASDVTVAAALEQRVDGTWKPFAFF